MGNSTDKKAAVDTLATMPGRLVDAGDKARLRLNQNNQMVIYYPPEKLKHVRQIVLQHHDQGDKSIGDYVINVLPTTTTTTTTTTQSRVVLTTIRSILETVDEAASLDLILAKIVAAIAKFYKKKPAGLFKSECHNNTTCEQEKNPSASQNLTSGSNANIDGIEEASTQELDPMLVEAGANSSRRGETWEEREDSMNKDALDFLGEEEK